MQPDFKSCEAQTGWVHICLQPALDIAEKMDTSAYQPAASFMARKTAYTRHSDEFKLTAVKLSELPDVLVKDVAESLDIHPFMLSRCEARC